MDRYAVVGHPVAHSQSPAIHARFAELTGQHIAYDRLELPLDGFLTGMEAARAGGLCGGNVTVPFKLEAFAWAQHRSARAELAQACNTFWFEADGVHADNTDGVGLVRDITRNAGVALRGARVLLVGARQPHPGQGAFTGDAVRRLCHRTRRNPTTSGRSRHRRLLDSQSITDIGQGQRRKRHQKTQAQADVHG